MSDTPKFTVVDRRKFRGEDDATPAVVASESKPDVQPEAEKAAPRLTLVEAPKTETGNVETLPDEPVHATQVGPQPVLVRDESAVAVADEDELAGEFGEEDGQAYGELPAVANEDDIRMLKMAYDTASQRLEDLVRAQNPGQPAQEKIGLAHLAQQLYLSGLMQMGAGTPEGQRPKVDIVGAGQTIALLGVLEEKTAGNLTAEEEGTMQAFLYELRATFVELTRMISVQPPMPPPPGGGKR